MKQNTKDSRVVGSPLSGPRSALRVLSHQDWDHWVTWGYVIVKNAVPPKNVARLRTLLWEFQEMDPRDPKTWGKEPGAKLRGRRGHKIRRRSRGIYSNSGFVNVYNHQYLWDNRQQQRLYDAFVDVWGREDLWVTLDRANLNPPNRRARRFDGFIHWDVDTSRDDTPPGVQGVLSLVDSNPRMGGFQCVPELFRTLYTWRETQPKTRNPFFPDLTGFDVVSVNLKAGDLLIFNSLLPHGIRPNRSFSQVRLAQYISMMPAPVNDHDLRARRIRSWRDLEPAPGFQRDPRYWEKKKAKRAKLTPLGKKLLGIESWL